MNVKFSEVFRFEFIYQLQRPWNWLFFIVLVVLNFLMTRDATLSEALFEEFFVNSPFAVAKTTVFGNLIWLVMAAVVAGDAAARDVYTRMHPLIYTSSVSKAEYLAGKFLAALVVNCLLLLAVQAGIVIAIYSPGVDPELLSPFRLATYLNAYAFIALPTAFVATAIQFTLASGTGRPMASYAGSVLLVFMGFFVASILLFKRGLGTLLDPIGIRFIVEDIAHLWTTAEKNFRLVKFEGIVRENRLLWIGVGVVFLLFAYVRFRFRHYTPKEFRFQLSTIKIFRREGLWQTTRTPVDQNILKEVRPTFDFSTHLHQIFSLSWASFKTLVFSWVGLALLVFIPLLTVPVVIDQMETNSGVLLPTTIRVISELTAPLSAELSRWVIIPAFIIFFAGELIWREREARLGEIIDTIPGSEWTPIVGKFIGIGLVLVVFTTFQMAAGMLAQIVLGYTRLEPGLYLKILFGLQLPEYLLFAILVLAVHVVVDQKYIGHMVAIIVYVFLALSSLFGVEHSLLVFGAGPAWYHTEMRGFGNSIGPWLWFKLYWAAWALLLAVVAKVLWVRGVHKTLRTRILMSRANLSRQTLIVGAFAVLAVFVLGGFIFYNTNIRHEYLTTSQMKERQAEHETRFGRFKNAPQPQITRAKLNVEIYPDEGEVKINGDYGLINLTEVAIDTIHVTTVASQVVSFDRPTSLVLHSEDFGHSIFVLDRVLQPGDSVKLSFEARLTSKGFRENGGNEAIVSNGTHFMNDWFPQIGYKASRELVSPADRREYGLTPRPLIASLYDSSAYRLRGEGIVFEATISTDSEQTAVAPGALIRSWKRDNRNYFHYKTDGAIGNEWAFFSARYAVREEEWTSSDSPARVVTIRIFHMPDHTVHLDRMITSIRSSLDYYSKNFGPYPYNHLTVVEGPGNGTGLHADATMLTHAEGFSLWNPDNDELGFDFPSAVVAHEIAHQWTVPYANVEGAPVMSESVAWYYAMKQVENTKGEEHLKKLLSDMRQPYPYAPIRRGEPLIRGLDPYLSYRRGPFALYTLSEYLGDQRVNQALRNLLEDHKPPTAPLATTLDLYDELEAVTPDSLNYLLQDLFKANTYWNLKVERAVATQTESNNCQLRIDIDAHKIVADSAGVQTDVKMDEWLEIGAFVTGVKKPIYLQKHRIRSGKQTFTLNLSQSPSRVGIDPNHLMIDMDLEDNFRDVKVR